MENLSSTLPSKTKRTALVAEVSNRDSSLKYLRPRSTPCNIQPHRSLKQCLSSKVISRLVVERLTLPKVLRQLLGKYLKKVTLWSVSIHRLPNLKGFLTLQGPIRFQSNQRNNLSLLIRIYRSKHLLTYHLNLRKLLEFSTECMAES